MTRGVRASCLVVACAFSALTIAGCGGTSADAQLAQRLLPNVSEIDAADAGAYKVRLVSRSAFPDLVPPLCAGIPSYTHSLQVKRTWQVVSACKEELFVSANQLHPATPGIFADSAVFPSDQQARAAYTAFVNSPSSRSIRTRGATTKLLVSALPHHRNVQFANLTLLRGRAIINFTIEPDMHVLVLPAAHQLAALMRRAEPRPFK